MPRIVSSFSEKTQASMMIASSVGKKPAVIYPVVVVKVQEVETCEILQSGAGSCFVFGTHQLVLPWTFDHHFKIISGAMFFSARFHPGVIKIKGDVFEQSFYQVWIREEDRDTLKLYWIKDLDSQTVRPFWFTRALLYFISLSLLFWGVIQHLLENCRARYSEIKSRKYLI